MKQSRPLVLISSYDAHYWQKKTRGSGCVGLGVGPATLLFEPTCSVSRKFFHLTVLAMDPALHPPINLRPLSSRPISTKNVAKRIGQFVDNFQARTTAAQAGSSAVTVQLQKLKDAMQEESARK